MTTEELEKEAEEKYSEVDREFIACQDEGEVFNIGYVLGAEPREKRIAELEEDNREWEKANDKWRILYFSAQTELNMAREVILNLHNAGRDVLMCRAEEKAYENLSVAISDIRIKQLLKGLEVKQEQRIKELEAQVKYWKSEYDKLFNED